MKKLERITIRIDAETKEKIISEVGKNGFGKYLRKLITQDLAKQKG